MKLGFLMLFFLLFNTYLLLAAIFYLNTERFWLKVKGRIIDYQKKLFMRRIDRIDRKHHMSWYDKWYFHRALKSADKLWAFHLAEEKSSPRTKRLLEEVYTEGLNRRFKKVLRLDPAAQFMLINRIPQIGFMNNQIKNNLLKSLRVEDHDIRMLTLYVIISVKSANFVMEALYYISVNHLGYNEEMLSYLIMRAYELIPEFDLRELITERKKLSIQVRHALIIVFGKFDRSERLKYGKELLEWFFDEENAEVRKDFYTVVTVDTSMDEFNDPILIQDLKSYYTPLKLAVMQKCKLKYDEEVLDILQDDLIEESNVDVIYEAVRLLLEHSQMTRQDFIDLSPKLETQVLRTYDYLKGVQT